MATRRGRRGSGRRGNGEGTITQRADGRWEARVTLLDGRRKCFYGKTRQEVARKLTEARRSLDTGSSVIADERLTVAAYFGDWLERMRPPRIRPSTHRRYTQLLAHVTSAYGDVRLTRLSARQLAAFYLQLQQPRESGGAGLSATSAHHVHVVLRQALDDALKLGLVVANVTDRVDAPRMRRSGVQYLTPDETLRFLEGARGERLEALYVLAIASGMRLGELLALTWRHVDLEAGALQVVASLQRVGAGHDGWQVGEPKTAQSRRRVTLPPLAVEALRAHRARQLAERIAVGARWHERDLVFCNAVGDHLNAQAVTRDHFQKLLARLGLPRRRFHDLRHTTASLLLTAGVHHKIMSEALGHAKSDLTLNIYSHVTPDMQREAADAMEAMLRRRSSHGVHKEDGSP